MGPRTVIVWERRKRRNDATIVIMMKERNRILDGTVLITCEGVLFCELMYNTVRKEVTMLKIDMKSFTILPMIFLLASFVAQESLANQHALKGGSKSLRALEMQVQKNLAQANVSNKMLRDQIAALENRIKSLEDRVKENEREIKFLKRLRK